MSAQWPPCNPNHHLWRNKRYWWTAFTVVREGFFQIRVRESLRTEDVEVARHRRDERMRHYASLPDHDVVCLSRLHRTGSAGAPAAVGPCSASSLPATRCTRRPSPPA